MNEIKSLQQIDTTEIWEGFQRVRRQTLDILEPLEIEDYVIQTDYFMSPPRWHLGHVSWFYEQVLKKHWPDYRPYKTNFNNYLNSYYRSFGEPFDKGKRGTVSRPTVRQTLDYARWINSQVQEFLSDNGASVTPEITHLFLLGLNHEYQHQELLVYDLQHLLQDEYHPGSFNTPPGGNGQPVADLESDMIRIPGGLFELGFGPDAAPDAFAYDIEKPLHKVYLNDYMIDRYPVTNGRYLEFIAAGGYNDFRYWLSDGWDQVLKHKWTAPLYWEQDENGRWFKRDFRGLKTIEEIAHEPVTHVSYYEAHAFARWAGRRLPTEAEWEKAAAWDEDASKKRLFPWGDAFPDHHTANLIESRIWSPTAVNSRPDAESYYGCRQMIGDTWEWTSSEFMPYPGFKSGFAEYNDKWFGNQKVLRGGSFATSRYQIRNTYRNFFRCDERWLYSGFRCAADVQTG